MKKPRPLWMAVTAAGFLCGAGRAQPSVLDDKSRIAIERPIPQDGYTPEHAGYVSDLFRYLLRQTGTPGGMEEYSPELHGSCEPGAQSPTGILGSRTSLRDGLDQVVKLFPDYKWTANDGVISLAPVVGASRLLDSPVAEFQWNTAFPMKSVLRDLGTNRDVTRAAASLHYIELGYGGIGQAGSHPPPPPDPSKGEALAIHNQTLRSTLNAIAVSYRGVWGFFESTCNGQTTFTLRLLESKLDLERPQ
jgi:hypothetical protein